MSNEKTETTENKPKSIGIILDGNRRWAKEKGLTSLQGHKSGSEKVLEVCEWANDAGIQELILYVFSSENWNRSEEEVGHLMELFSEFIKSHLTKLEERDVRIKCIGDRTRLSTNLLDEIEKAEKRTMSAKKGIITFALSYGGRSEIVAAVNTLMQRGAKEVTEKSLQDALWSAGMMDPDLIIRTGGEKRLSNFLPWQSVYSELFFTNTKWPSFSKEEFEEILAEYAERERRHGM